MGIPRYRARLAEKKLLLAVALACATLGGCRSADERVYPDVVLITVDTLRADRLGAYGFAYGTSPNIDALASHGILFERAIASAGRTVPAHASIMTSRYTREHSVGHLNGKSTLRGLETLAMHFRHAGYDTAAFIGNILLTHTTGLGQGFEVFDDEIETPELNRRHVVERVAADTTERALRWLERPRDRPFFVWVHYQDPHGPYTPPAEDRSRFQIQPAAGERPLPIGEGSRTKGAIPAYQAVPGLSLPSEYEGRYAGEIFYADRWIGRLIEAIDARRPKRSEIILLTADHGESLGENENYYVHTDSSTPDVAHVPLVIRAPGLAPSRRKELVSHVDVLPTLLGLAGLPVPDDARGIDLGPIVRGEAQLPDRFVYCDNGFQLTAYRAAGFVQLQGLEGAWAREDGERAPIRARWREFEWRPGEPWRPLPRSKTLSKEIAAYARQAEPMELLPAPDPELLKQLRALGYAED